MGYIRCDVPAHQWPPHILPNAGHSQTHTRAGVDRQNGSPAAWDVQNSLTHVVQGSAVTQDSDSCVRTWGMSIAPVWYFRSTENQAALTRAESAASAARGL